MRAFFQDLRYSFRTFGRKPLFTFITILVLALGLGANTAIFSLMNELFLRPLPVPDPQQLVRVYESSEEESDLTSTSYPNYLDLRNAAKSIGEFAAHSHTAFSFSLGGDPESLHGEVVSGNYFDVLRIQPVLGRMLQPQDDMTIGAHPVAVISNSLWKSKFHENTTVLGSRIYVNGHPFTVIGVAPENFTGSYLTSQSDLYATIAMYEQVRPTGIPLTARGWGWLQITGRLHKGISKSQAEPVISGIAGNLKRSYPRINDRMIYVIRAAHSLPEELNQAVSKALTYFMILTFLVLIVVCANISGFMLPHAISRRREMAIRASLGAARSRLLTHWITESVLLSFLGGIAGIFTALWCREGMKMLLPPEYNAFIPAFSLDLRMFLFVFLLSLMTGIAGGLAPVFHYRKEGFAWKEHAAAAPRSGKLFGFFVAAQTSASVVVLIAAALLLQSLMHYSKFDVGFNTKDLLTATIDLQRNGYDETRGRAFYKHVVEEIKSMPGISSVSFAIVTPLGGNEESLGYEIPGHQSAEGKSFIGISNNIVGPDYFRTMGIPIVRGRAFENREIDSASSNVVVINEAMAKRFWPNQNPVAKQIRLADDGSPWMEIIGVAKNSTYYTIGEEPMPYVYLPFGSHYVGMMTLQIRTTKPADTFSSVIRKSIASIDPTLAIYGVDTLEVLRKNQLFPVRAMALISNLIGMLSVILCALGIYGVVSYSVRLRRTELGIRMALGATKSSIVQHVMKHGVGYSFLGTLLGVLIALIVTRFLAAVLFHISALDPFTFLLVPCALMAIAFLAALIPGISAARTDPARVIRYE